MTAIVLAEAGATSAVLGRGRYREWETRLGPSVIFA
ncbi:hypothetical protein JOF55_003259 [Haloactinomyces albus]|uniref:Uncharacterized protein n=1 Tax=Haloactinomyces albus TaxID=1352928 RepID=A0AAE3ZDT4_9ACTN|nr:hypothetical protein [Haloactinomyces albus]